MKKIKIFIFMFLLIVLFCPSKTTNVLAQDKTLIRVENFSIESKIYDNQTIKYPNLKFINIINNQEVILTKNDYEIEFHSSKQITKALPKTFGGYTAILSLKNSSYELDKNYNCEFVIHKAQSFTINLKDITICENMALKNPEYEIIGKCYDKLNEKFYLNINNQKILFNQIKRSDLSNGIYDIIMEIDNLPDYENIVINKAKYYVNKNSLSFKNKDFDLVVTKDFGISIDKVLKCEFVDNLNKFDKFKKVDLEFSIYFDLGENIEYLQGYTCKLKYKIKDLNKFKVFSVKDDTITELPYIYNDGYVIFSIDEDVKEFTFCYQREKASMYVYSIILLIISFIEIFLAIKVFKLHIGKNSKVINSVCIPVWSLIYFNTLDIVLFLASIWVFILSTIVFIYSVYTYKNGNDNNKTENKDITSEDEDLYNFIAKNKQVEKYELEEIIEELD